MSKKMYCSICFDEIIGWSYSAEPVNDGYACLMCYTSKVMKERSRLAKLAAEKHRNDKNE